MIAQLFSCWVMPAPGTEVHSKCATICIGQCGGHLRENPYALYNI